MKLRRILSVILSLVMLLGLMPMAYAAEGNSAVLGEVGGIAGGVNVFPALPGNVQESLPALPGDSATGHIHSYDVSVIAPTCVSVGYTRNTCDSCGYSYDHSYISIDQKAGHNYVRGVCKICGNSVLGEDWIVPNFNKGDYTMVALPDTQNMVTYWPNSFYRMTNWVADNKDELNIKAVMHMGDMVNNDTAAQWEVLKTGMSAIDASGIPWMPMRGNHDSASGFNAAFPYESFSSDKNWFGGSFVEGNLDHTYWFVNAGQREYLIFSLGYAPSAEVILWAKNIADSYPEKNIILTTHALMDSDGNFLDGSDYNVGDYIPGYPGLNFVQAAVRASDNAALALCGHVPSENIVRRTDYNGAGAAVSSLLLDSQDMDVSSPHGMIALFTFYNDSNRVDVHWYSTYYDAFYRSQNQFSITVPHVHKHSYVGKDVLPTCTGRGYTIYDCQFCEDSYVVYTIDAYGHSYDETVTEPTCTDKGYTSYRCGVCGHRYVGNYTDALGHSYEKVVTAPTCTEAGYTTYTCKECSYSYVGDHVAPSHSYDILITDPTCTKKGYEAYTCTACGEIYGGNYIDALGHSYEKVVTAPTCTESGYTTNTCAACGDVYLSDELAPLGHGYEALVTAPTCTEGGYTTNTCAACGDVYLSDELAPLGHGYEALVTEPTCTEAGYTTNTCAACGDSYESDPVEALGHDEVKDEAVAPDCVNTGLMEGSHCSRCKEVLMKQETVEALGHKWGKSEITKKPTVHAEGETTYTCTECGETMVEKIDKLPGCNGKHTWDEGKLTKEPTNKEEGEMSYSCTVCGEKKTEKIDRLADVGDFKDIAERDYYYNSVKWALEEAITTGTSKDKFSPSLLCTRAQVVTFLWRAAGEPIARNTVNPFNDVKEDEYYYDAVLWALENGITGGISEELFAPSAPCTRAQVVTFLWRAAGEPEPDGSKNPFNDVTEGRYYYDAVIWAVEQEITKGLTLKSFGTDASCTRGQIVTFLWRAFAK